MFHFLLILRMRNSCMRLRRFLNIWRHFTLLIFRSSPSIDIDTAHSPPLWCTSPLWCLIYVTSIHYQLYPTAPYVLALKIHSRWNIERSCTWLVNGWLHGLWPLHTPYVIFSHFCTCASWGDILVEFILIPHTHTWSYSSAPCKIANCFGRTVIFQKWLGSQPSILLILRERSWWKKMLHFRKHKGWLLVQG